MCVCAVLKYVSTHALCVHVCARALLIQSRERVRARALLVEIDGKLVDNFSHESDVTSLKDSFYFTIVFYVNSEEKSSFKSLPNSRHLLDS